MSGLNKMNLDEFSNLKGMDNKTSEKMSSAYKKNRPN